MLYLHVVSLLQGVNTRSELGGMLCVQGIHVHASVQGPWVQDAFKCFFSTFY